VSRLERDFFARSVHDVAPELIGATLLVAGVGGRIVEVEAYDQDDPASHAFRGRTERNAAMFGPAGHAYVYRSYGIHALLNAVCEPVGVGAAVLIRALEPLVGIEEMRMRRGRTREDELCSGPGKLTQALGVELSENGTSLLDGPITIRPGEGANRDRDRVVVGTRIGITKAVDLRWRFCAVGNSHVSRPRPQ
jgi:DNA-3-methyladenine glycosylase